MKVEVPTYKNLLHTWSLLEPGVTREYDWEKESFEVVIKRWLHLQMLDYDVSHRSYGDNNFFSATVYHSGEAFGSDPWPTEGMALLFAFLRAIAQQRYIDIGAWRHFKEGAIAHVDCHFSTNARRSTTPPASTVTYRDYRLEDDPEVVLTLFWRESTGFWFYVDSEVDFGDIVFYHYPDTGNAWVREARDFLDVTGLKYPAELAAKLRFEQVRGES
jgi:hypothetical protein